MKIEPESHTFILIENSNSNMLSELYLDSIDYFPRFPDNVLLLKDLPNQTELAL